MTTIIGVSLSNRVETAIEVQNILTTYGCYIKTRLGLHQIVEAGCTNSGLILLEVPNKDMGLELMEKLNSITGAETKSMNF